MEHANNIAAVPYFGDWSDLRDWNAVWAELGPDSDGVVASGSATAIECRNTLLRSESERLETVGIGLDNIIVVAMPDAVLIADKSRGQDVKLAVSKLAEKRAAQATQFPRDHRP